MKATAPAGVCGGGLGSKAPLIASAILSEFVATATPAGLVVTFRAAVSTALTVVFTVPD